MSSWTRKRGVHQLFTVGHSLGAICCYYLLPCTFCYRPGAETQCILLFAVADATLPARCRRCGAICPYHSLPCIFRSQPGAADAMPSAICRLPLLPRIFRYRPGADDAMFCPLPFAVAVYRLPLLFAILWPPVSVLPHCQFAIN